MDESIKTPVYRLLRPDGNLENVYSNYLINRLLGTNKQIYKNTTIAVENGSETTSTTVNGLDFIMKNSDIFHNKSESISSDGSVEYDIIEYLYERFESEKLEEHFHNILPYFSILNNAYLLSVLYVFRYIINTSNTRNAIFFLFKFFNYDYKIKKIVNEYFLDKRALLLEYLEEGSKLERSVYLWYIIGNSIHTKDFNTITKNEILQCGYGDIMIPGSNYVSNITHTFLYTLSTMKNIPLNLSSNIINTRNTTIASNSSDTRQTYYDIVGELNSVFKSNSITGSDMRIKKPENNNNRNSFMGNINFTRLREIMFEDASKYTEYGLLKAPYEINTRYDFSNDFFKTHYLTSVDTWYNLKWKRNVDFTREIKGVPSFYFPAKDPELTPAKFINIKSYFEKLDNGIIYAGDNYRDKEFTSSPFNKAYTAYGLLKNGANLPFITKMFEEILTTAAIFIARLATEYDLNIIDIMTGNNIINVPQHNTHDSFSLSFEKLYENIISNVINKYLASYMCVPIGLENLVMTSHNSSNATDIPVNGKNIYGSDTMGIYLETVLLGTLFCKPWYVSETPEEIKYNGISYLSSGQKEDQKYIYNVIRTETDLLDVYDTYKELCENTQSFKAEGYNREIASKMCKKIAGACDSSINFFKKASNKLFGTDFNTSSASKTTSRINNGLKSLLNIGVSLGDGIQYLHHKYANILFDYTLININAKIADYDVICHKTVGNDVYNSCKNNAIKDTGIQLNDKYVEIPSLSSTKYEGLFEKNNTLLSTANIIANTALSSSSDVKSIQACYTDNTLNIKDITKNTTSNLYTDENIDYNVFKIPLSTIFNEFDAYNKTTNSQIAFITESIANSLSADFYVKKIINKTSGGEDTITYALYINNDIKTKIIKPLVEMFSGDDNTDVIDAFKNAINNSYDTLVNKLISEEPKYSVTLGLLRNKIKDVLLNVSNNITENGITDGYSVDSNVDEATYQSYIKYSSLRNTICSFRLVYFDLIKRDCFNILLNMFMTQHKNTLENNSDFIYFDYSDFNFNTNNRNSYSKIPRSFVKYGTSGVLSSKFGNTIPKIKI